MATAMIMNDPARVQTETQSFASGWAGILKLIGSSTLNPDGSDNTCVSVALAKTMMYPNVNIFWENVLGYRWGSHRGMDEKELESVIHLSKWQFKCRVFTTTESRTAFENYSEDFLTHAIARYGEGRAIAAYRRKDGTGHCVQAGFLTFQCFQHNDEGIDVTKELEEAVEILIYVLKCPPNSKEHLEMFDRLRWDMIQRRKDPERLQKIMGPILMVLHGPGPQYDKAMEEVKNVDLLNARIFERSEEVTPCPFRIPEDGKEPECNIFFTGVIS